MGLIDLVVETPYVDRGMIEVLPDEFAQLLMGVFGLLTRYPVYKRNLCPNDEAE